MRRWNRANTKEADSIHLQPLPDGSHWRAWRANTINAVVAAAGRQDDLAQDWIMRVETDENWALVAAALSKIAKGEIGREIMQSQTTALNNQLVVRGRVLLALVFRYYASSTTGQVLYDMNHLQTLKLQGDNLDGVSQHLERGS